MIPRERIHAFDVETKGVADLFDLQPCRAVGGDAWLTTCATAHWRSGRITADGYVRPTTEQIAEWLRARAEAGDYVVGWNTPFDVAWLIALGLRDLVYRVKWLDGLLLYRHLINAPRYRPGGNTPMGLKPAVARFLPSRAGYEDDIDYDDESPENICKLLKYNKRDSAYTLAIVCHVVEQLAEPTLRNALIEAACIPDVAETYVTGIRINPAACQALADELEEKRRVAFIKLKFAHPEITEQVLASPKQLADLLFVQWGLPVVELTETDQPSTNKRTLAELAGFDERAGMVHAYRDAAYCKAKFGDSPLASLEYNGDGCSRPQARIFGTYTGRMTYSSKAGRGKAQRPTGVALHQWKRDPTFRKVIEPPPGYDLVEFDFAGQEFRWMAVESGDPTMLELCMPGEDAHSYMGAKIAGLNYRWLMDNASTPEGKPKRQLGKVGNLSLQYRTLPQTLITVAAVQYQVKLTDIEARGIWSTYRTTYRKVPDYWRRQIKRAKAQGFVQTLAGRRINLGMPDTWKYADGNDASWSHESTAINFPIQGIGADQKYLGLLCMHDVCRRYDARFYFELHDGLFYIVPSDKAEAFAHDGKRVLSNLPYDRAWNVKLPIAFPVDGKRGPSWGELKEFK